MEGQRAAKHRAEARGQKAGHSFVLIDIEDELEHLGA
jgi:hypothetical protein